MSEPILCPDCGHDIARVYWDESDDEYRCSAISGGDYCECPNSPATIARAPLAERDAKLAAVRELAWVRGASDLDQLGAGSVILDSEGLAWQKDGVGNWWAGAGSDATLLSTGFDGGWHLPARIIWDAQ